MSDLVKNLHNHAFDTTLPSVVRIDCADGGNRIQELEERLGRAYQSFGQIAADADIFDTPAAIALLDLLSKD